MTNPTVFTPVIIQFTFWLVTGLIGLLVAIVGKLFVENKQLRKKAVDSAVAGIQGAVEELSKTIRDLANRSEVNFAKGANRMDDLDRRQSVQETKCDERHNSGARN